MSGSVSAVTGLVLNHSCKARQACSCWRRADALKGVQQGDSNLLTEFLAERSMEHMMTMGQCMPSLPFSGKGKGEWNAVLCP